MQRSGVLQQRHRAFTDRLISLRIRSARRCPPAPVHAPQQLLPRWIAACASAARLRPCCRRDNARQPLAGPFYRAETPSQDSAGSCGGRPHRGRAARGAVRVRPARRSLAGSDRMLLRAVSRDRPRGLAFDSRLSLRVRGHSCLYLSTVEHCGGAESRRRHVKSA